MKVPLSHMHEPDPVRSRYEFVSAGSVGVGLHISAPKSRDPRTLHMKPNPPLTGFFTTLLIKKGRIFSPELYMLFFRENYGKSGSEELPCLLCTCTRQ